MEVEERGRKREIYTYQAPWLIYAMNWSVRPDKKFRLALGSFLEDYTNKVEIVQLDEENNRFLNRGTFDHPYPATKIMWCPDRAGTGTDLLASSGDYVRLWEPKSDKAEVELKCILNNVATLFSFLFLSFFSPFSMDFLHNRTKIRNFVHL
jgi:WD repeat-containing protein 68